MLRALVIILALQAKDPEASAKLSVSPCQPLAVIVYAVSHETPSE
jgi:hypothetical protein